MRLIVALAVLLSLTEVFAGSCSSNASSFTYNGSTKHFVCDLCVNSEEKPENCMYKCFKGVQFESKAFGGPALIAYLGTGYGETKDEAEENAAKHCINENCYVKKAVASKKSDYKPTIGTCSSVLEPVTE